MGRAGPLGALLGAVLLLLGARALGAEANRDRATWPQTLDPPYAPAPESARLISLGYREVMADLLWVRALGYVGGDDDRASSTRGLIESIVALDPSFERVYAWGGLAMSWIGTEATNEDMLAAIRILESGMARFPSNFKLPLYAGQIYTVELETDDPAQKTRWELEGARLLERAVRIPGAPKDVGTFAAHLRSKLGQHDKAVRDLRELIVYTSNPKQRKQLVEKLAEMEGTNAAALGYELEIEQRRFEDRWQADRPELTPTMYLLVGPRLPTRFRLEDLAVDRDLVGVDPVVEPLPPLPD